MTENWFLRSRVFPQSLLGKATLYLVNYKSAWQGRAKSHLLAFFWPAGANMLEKKRPNMRWCVSLKRSTGHNTANMCLCCKW